MGTDSEVGNETRCDGLAEDIASDGGVDWIAVVAWERQGQGHLVSFGVRDLRSQRAESTQSQTPPIQKGKLGLTVFGRKNVQKTHLANVGIEPKTFALLARRSNQLS